MNNNSNNNNNDIWLCLSTVSFPKNKEKNWEYYIPTTIEHFKNFWKEEKDIAAIVSAGKITRKYFFPKKEIAVFCIQPRIEKNNICYENNDENNEKNIDNGEDLNLDTAFAVTNEN